MNGGSARAPVAQMPEWAFITMGIEWVRKLAESGAFGVYFNY
jgi:hypothetical protein